MERRERSRTCMAPKIPALYESVSSYLRKESGGCATASIDDASSIGDARLTEIAIGFGIQVRAPGVRSVPKKVAAKDLEYQVRPAPHETGRLTDRR